VFKNSNTFKVVFYLGKLDKNNGNGNKTTCYKFITFIY
jgi:hypothetical protein